MPRPCTCENHRPGEPYDQSQCVRCWLFHNSEHHRLVWSDDPSVARPISGTRTKKQPCNPGERVANPRGVLAAASERKRGLGDAVEGALSAIGITKDRVEKWLGRPCGCKERREKLNRLGEWAKRVLSGKTDDAEKHLESLVEDLK